jgi:reductive dehalogenase
MLQLFIDLLTIMGAAGLAVQAFIGLSFFISCLREKDPRASLFALLQFLGMTAVLIIYLVLAWAGFFKAGTGLFLLVAGYVLVALAVVLILARIGKNPRASQGTKGLFAGEVKRFDERDQVFARNRSLRPGSKPYHAYYEAHPERENYDAQRRAKGGPMGPAGVIDRPHELANVAMTLACVSMPHYLSDPEKVKPKSHFLLSEKLSQGKVEIFPEEATERVKGFVLNLGANLVGVAEINPLWVYSHRGEIFHENWEDWGKEIRLDHKYAVVFAEEMALELVGTAPHTPTTVESMKNYAKGADISTQLAAFIANLGYSATANHLRHYEVILPPLAVDAGLGEVGRLGYLMTKEFGPRVRLSAVTTDLPLVPDKPVDIGVADFCGFCKKCAVCCPSQSIPMDDMKAFNGTLRWKLNDETCFDYWGKVGTDCNVCMRVCPWSHARTWPHRLIVWMISRNRLARRLFARMDDIFYGRKPKPKAGPGWARYR